MITQKKESWKIRLNVDMQHVNITIKPTHCSVPTVNELCHQLNGAARFKKSNLPILSDQIGEQVNATLKDSTVHLYGHLTLQASSANQESY